MLCRVSFLFLSLWGSVCRLCLYGMSFLSLEFSSLILIRIWSTTLIWNYSSSSPSCDSEWVFSWCPMLPIRHLHVFYIPCFCCLIPLIYFHLLTSCLPLGPLFLYIFPLSSLVRLLSFPIVFWFQLKFFLFFFTEF